MSIIVYTAITNNHDEISLQPLFDEDKDVKRIAYLDNITMGRTLNCNETFTWELKNSYDKFIESKRNCQIHKILSHIYTRNYDYSVWIDGSVTLKYPISKMVDENMGMHDIALIKHSERDCIYQEYEDCITFKLDSQELLEKQMHFYRLDGFPPRFGLSETPVIIRKNTERVAEFNNYWWSILCTQSKRDQLSFDYVRWKLGMKVKYFPGNIHNNPYFDIAKHKVLREHEK